MTPDALAALPPFASITFNAEESNGENIKPEVAKTGLGSSAAMTTAVVAALLHYLGVVNLASVLNDHYQENDAADLDVVHVIAQTAHCLAQGKVGSGFDVSSAVYGSHRYVRFSPEVLSSAQVSLSFLPCLVLTKTSCRSIIVFIIKFLSENIDRLPMFVTGIMYIYKCKYVHNMNFSLESVGKFNF